MDLVRPESYPELTRAVQFLSSKGAKLLDAEVQINVNRRVTTLPSPAARANNVPAGPGTAFSLLDHV